MQALRDGAIPEEEREKYMDVVLDETARLTALVRDLLDLSRIESGKFPMEMARVDLCEQMRRSLLSFEAASRKSASRWRRNCRKHPAGSWPTPAASAR